MRFTGGDLIFYANYTNKFKMTVRKNRAEFQINNSHPTTQRNLVRHAGFTMRRELER